MNPLDQYPALRAKFYLAQWVTNLILGVVGVVLTTLGLSPLWFIIVTAAFNFVWSYTGITAQGNTPSAKVIGDEDYVPELDPEFRELEEADADG